MCVLTFFFFSFCLQHPLEIEETHARTVLFRAVSQTIILICLLFINLLLYYEFLEGRNLDLGLFLYLVL